MRTEGFVKSWNLERGNGWLEVDSVRDPVFAHVKDFRGKDPEPVPGQRVSLELSYNWEGRARARDVKLLRGRVTLTQPFDSTGAPSTQQHDDVAVASVVKRPSWLSRLLGRGNR